MVVLQAAPSWDLVITLGFVIGVTYGFIMLRDRILVAILSLYAGIIVAEAFVEPIHKFFNGDIALLNKLWIQSSMSPFTIKIALLTVVALVINAKSGIGPRRWHLSFFELGAYSFLAVAIALSTVFHFMEPDKLQAYTQVSKLAALIVEHRVLWLLGPILLLAFMGSNIHDRRGDY